MGSHLSIGQFPKTHFEEIKVLEITDAYPVPTNLGSVRRSDTLFGGADFIPSQSMLADAIDLLVKVEYEVGPIGEFDAIFGINALVFESVQFG